MLLLLGLLQPTERDTAAASGGSSVSPNLFYRTELGTQSRLNPSVGKNRDV